MRALFELDDDTDVFGRLVAQPADALEFFVAHQVGDAHDEVGFVNAVRDRGDDDLEVALFIPQQFRHCRAPPRRPLPVEYAWSKSFLLNATAPVGKSGPVTNCIKSSTVASLGYLSGA
jgi:hypothetical protein